MDVPYELWDTPPAEVTQMHKKVRLVESVIMSLIMRKPADIVNDKCADQFVYLCRLMFTSVFHY